MTFQLAQLRQLVESLEGEADDVEIVLEVQIPGLSSKGGSFPNGSTLTPIVATGVAARHTVFRRDAVGQDRGPAYGPVKRITLRA